MSAARSKIFEKTPLEDRIYCFVMVAKELRNFPSQISFRLLLVISLLGF